MARQQAMDLDNKQSKLMERVSNKDLKAGGLAFNDYSDFAEDRFNFNPYSLQGDHDLRTSDALFNKQYFQSYWKSRQKHDAANYNIGETVDRNNDGAPDYVAFEVDGNGQPVKLVGYNNYYLTPKGYSESAYKHQYYSDAPANRNGRSYSEFMTDYAVYKDGFLPNDVFDKRRSDAKAKPVYKFMDFFKNHAKLAAYFNDTTSDEQHKLCNLLYDAMKEAFFDGRTNEKHKNYLKSKGGLSPYYKEFASKLLTYIANPKNEGELIIMYNHMVTHKKAALTGVIRPLTKAMGYQLTSEEAEQLYIKEMTRMFNSGKKVVPEDFRDADARKAWERQHGYRFAAQYN